MVDVPTKGVVNRGGGALWPVRSAPYAPHVLARIIAPLVSIARAETRAKKGIAGPDGGTSPLTDR